MAQWLTRRTAHESEIRWRREETMRMLRWAAELAASDDPARIDVGVAALDALDDSELLQGDDQAFITAVLAAVLDPELEEYAGGQVIQED